MYTVAIEIYTLSLHDALPILPWHRPSGAGPPRGAPSCGKPVNRGSVRAVVTSSYRLTSQAGRPGRSEEHTSELQSRRDLVCRLLLEKNKTNRKSTHCLCVGNT